MFNSLSNSLFMYRGGKLVTVKQGKHHRTIFHSAEIPLAEQQTGGTPGIGLLATDDKGSALSVKKLDEEEEHTFSVYGHDPRLPSPLTVLGFNGQLFISAHAYVLGNGYRAYSPALHRFLSPDSWSPFGPAGMNAYCYCEGDPVNRVDPSGHMLKTRSRSPSPKSAATKQITLLDINEPDTFSKLAIHLDIPSISNLSQTSKHINEMLKPTMKKIKESIDNPDPRALIESARDQTLGNNLGHSGRILVEHPNIDIERFARIDTRTADAVDNIRISREFRAAQRHRSPSRDSSTYGSDSEDEMQRTNVGIRRALNGPQL